MKINIIYKFLTVVIVAFLDQAAKFAVLSYLALQRPLPVFKGLNLYLTFNSGVAFGMFASFGDLGRWLLIIFAAAISLVLVVWILRSKNSMESFALAIILGGAIGNIIDRTLLGVVVDFIDVYYANWHWYTFNIADSAICIGITLLLWQQFFSASKTR